MPHDTARQFMKRYFEDSCTLYLWICKISSVFYLSSFSGSQYRHDTFIFELRCRFKSCWGSDIRQHMIIWGGKKQIFLLYIFSTLELGQVKLICSHSVSECRRVIIQIVVAEKWKDNRQFVTNPTIHDEWKNTQQIKFSIQKGTNFSKCQEICSIIETKSFSTLHQNEKKSNVAVV